MAYLRRLWLSFRFRVGFGGLLLCIAITICVSYMFLHFVHYPTVRRRWDARAGLREFAYRRHRDRLRHLLREAAIFNKSVPRRAVPVVPAKLHFVWTLQPHEFDSYHFLSLTSLLRGLRPDRLIFHTVHEPTGMDWTRFRANAAALEIRHHSGQGQLSSEPLLVAAREIAKDGGLFIESGLWLLRPEEAQEWRHYDATISFGTQAAAFESPRQELRSDFLALCGAPEDRIGWTDVPGSVGQGHAIVFRCSTLCSQSE